VRRFIIITIMIITIIIIIIIIIMASVRIALAPIAQIMGLRTQIWTQPVHISFGSRNKCGYSPYDYYCLINPTDNKVRLHWLFLR